MLRLQIPEFYKVHSPSPLRVYASVSDIDIKSILSPLQIGHFPAELSSPNKYEAHQE